MKEPGPQVISPTEQLPPVNKRVMVVCKGFRCLGFLGRDSKWREANRLTELADVSGWYVLPSE